jgi:hypothetical protein
MSDIPKARAGLVGRPTVVRSGYRGDLEACRIVCKLKVSIKRNIYILSRIEIFQVPRTNTHFSLSQVRVTHIEVMASQHIPLSPFDNIMVRFYIKSILCLPVEPGRKPKEVYNILSAALEKTVEDMPLLTGRVKLIQPDSSDIRPGRLELIVPADKNNRTSAKLHFNDMSEKLDYEDLMAAGMPQSELDQKVLLPSAGPMIPDMTVGADVLVVQANFVEGGCLLAVGIYHAAVDGSGLMIILKQWSEHCRQLQVQEKGFTSRVMPKGATDRQILSRLWHEAGNSLESYKGRKVSVEEYRRIGLKPPTTPPTPSNFQEPDVSKVLPKMLSSIFYLSANALLQLRKAASTASGTTSGVSDGDRPSISANDALTTLLWRCMTQARFPAGCKMAPDQEIAELDTTLDGRATFSSSLPAEYFGNVVLMNTTRVSHSFLVDPQTTLNDIALEFRKTVNVIDTAEVHSLFGIASCLPSYAHNSHPFATFEGNELVFSSMLQTDILEHDFGPAFGNDGRADLVRSPHAELDKICRRCMILPRQSTGGLEIFIAMPKEEMKRLLGNEEFAKYAKFSCH